MQGFRGHSRRQQDRSRFIKKDHLRKRVLEGAEAAAELLRGVGEDGGGGGGPVSQSGGEHPGDEEPVDPE